MPIFGLVSSKICTGSLYDAAPETLMHAHHTPWDSRTQIAHRMVVTTATHPPHCPMI